MEEFTVIEDYRLIEIENDDFQRDYDDNCDSSIIDESRAQTIYNGGIKFDI